MQDLKKKCHKNCDILSCLKQLTGVNLNCVEMLVNASKVGCAENSGSGQFCMISKKLVKNQF